jgi:DNA-binding transcriptional LysR family regulator
MPSGADGRRPAGLGIALLSTFLAEEDPALVRLLPDQHDPIDIWMVLHPDVQEDGRDAPWWQPWRRCSSPCSRSPPPPCQTHRD